MGLVEQAKKDIEKITGNAAEFGVELTFTSPSAVVAVATGIHAKHHTGFDEQGFPVNSKIASVAISEQYLTDAGYPVRTGGEVQLRGHKVAAADSTGVVNTYMIREWFPDEMIGLIVLILGDYE